MKKRHSIWIWLEFKHNILTPTVLTSNDLFIKRKGEQSQVLIVTFHGKTYVNDFAKRYEISLGIRSLPLKRFSISFTEFSVR